MPHARKEKATIKLLARVEPLKSKNKIASRCCRNSSVEERIEDAEAQEPEQSVAAQNKARKQVAVTPTPSSKLKSARQTPPEVAGLFAFATSFSQTPQNLLLLDH